MSPLIESSTRIQKRFSGLEDNLTNARSGGARPSEYLTVCRVIQAFRRNFPKIPKIVGISGNPSNFVAPFP